MLRLACIVVLALCCLHCASAERPAPSLTNLREHEAHCARAVMGKDSPYHMPLADPVTEPADLAWLDVLPQGARRTARAAGLEPLLVELLREQAEDASSTRVLSLQHQLTLRLLAFEAQRSSLAFETECTRRRVAELVATLDAQEAERQLWLATGSLVAGAGTGIFAGVCDLAETTAKLPAILAIVGGVLTAALGTAALLVPERSVTLEHRHNLLLPLYVGTDPDHLYPAFVFRMLTAVYPGDTTDPRTVLLQDFERILERYSGDEDLAVARATVFGAGGTYPRGLLEARAELLQALEFAVEGVARDLELLDQALVRVIGSAGQKTCPAGAACR